MRKLKGVELACALPEPLHTSKLSCKFKKVSHLPPTRAFKKFSGPFYLISRFSGNSDGSRGLGKVFSVGMV